MTDSPSETQPDRVYLDLAPVKSFLHSPSSAEALPVDPSPAPEEPPENPELQVRLSASKWADLTLAAPGPAEPCSPSPKADTPGESGA